MSLSPFAICFEPCSPSTLRAGLNPAALPFSPMWPFGLDYVGDELFGMNEPGGSQDVNAGQLLSSELMPREALQGTDGGQENAALANETLGPQIKSLIVKLVVPVAALAGQTDVDGEHDSDDPDGFPPTPPSDEPSRKKEKSKRAFKNNAKISKTKREDKEESLAEKKRQARSFITKQKAHTDAARKMGLNVTINHSESGVTIGGVYWKAPTNDATIPSTAEEMKAYSETLVTAMTNNDDCRERETTKSFTNRWIAGALYYSQDEFKAAAREIVATMTDIHRNGWTKSIYDKDQRELYQETMYSTFADRFEGVRELLMYSKRSCEDVMKGSRMYAIIGNPFVLVTRTASNQVSNVQKGQALKEAKALQKKRTRGDDSEDTSVADASRPKKRTRRNRAA